MPQQATAAEPTPAQPGQEMPIDNQNMVQQQASDAQPEQPIGDATQEQPINGEVPEAEEQVDTEIPEGADDSTMSLFAQLDPKDKETARKYIISMLQDADEGENADMSAEQPEQQLAETFIFKKGQIVSIQESERKEVKKSEVLKKHKNNKSPWTSPEFK